MKGIVASIFLVLAFAIPAQGQSQIESISVPFLVLIDNEFAKEHEGGCRFKTERQGFPTLEAAPTPYGPLVDATPSKGRFVTPEQSPLPGVEGCLFEIGLSLEPAEKYSFQMIVHAGSDPNWIIDMGEMTFGEIIDHAPKPITYHFDQETFATGSVIPETNQSAVATPSVLGEHSPVSLMVFIDDPELWEQSGSGCVGSGDASWMASDASVTISPADGGTEGQAGTIGVGEVSNDDMCTWSFPKSPPLLDTGAYLISIADQSVECETDKMAQVGDFYIAAVSADDDGMHCATVS